MVAKTSEAKLIIFAFTQLAFSDKYSGTYLAQKSQRVYSLAIDFNCNELISLLMW